MQPPPCLRSGDVKRAGARLTTRTAPLWHTNLRSEACGKFFAAGACSTGAGCYVVPVTREGWLALYVLAKEKGENARPDWKSEEPPSNTHDGRATAALLAWSLNWATMSSYCFFEALLVDLLEVESPLRLLKRIESEGIQTWRPLTLVNRDRSSSTTNFFKKLGLAASRLTSRSSLHGCPLGQFRPTLLHKTSRSKIGMQHFQSRRPHRPKFSHQPMLLPSRTCFVSHCRFRPVRRANAGVSSKPPTPSVFQKGNLPMLKMELRRKPTLVKKTIPRLQMWRQLPREEVKKRLG